MWGYYWCLLIFKRRKGGRFLVFAGLDAALYTYRLVSQRAGCSMGFGIEGNGTL